MWATVVWEYSGKKPNRVRFYELQMGIFEDLLLEVYKAQKNLTTELGLSHFIIELPESISAKPSNLFTSSACIHVTNRLYVGVRLFNDRSWKLSKCGKNKRVAHEPLSECVTYVLTTF